MSIGVAAIQAIAGMSLLALSFVLDGVVSRPIVVAGVALLVLAALSGRRETRRQIRVFTQEKQAVAAAIAVVIVGLLGFWALTLAVQRHIVLGKLEAFAAEGQQIQSELAQRVASTNQLMGDQTAKVQDWHSRLSAWIAQDLGPFYGQRLGTPLEDLTYPPQMPARLRVFWDRLSTDLGAIEQFRKEFSSLLFKPGT